MTLCWLAGVCAGSGVLWRYAATPGEAAAAPSQRPVWAEGGVATLTVFVHPRCPCSRATIDELARILTASPAAVRAAVVFVLPDGAASGWERGELWRRAAAVPGVELRVDADGVEARRFGAATSGHAALYAGDGRLLFTGGLTAARGMSGDSIGNRAVAALLRGAPAARSGAPVFGCPLFDAGERPEACCPEADS